MIAPHHGCLGQGCTRLNWHFVTRLVRRPVTRWSFTSPCDGCPSPRLVVLRPGCRRRDGCVLRPLKETSCPMDWCWADNHEFLQSTCVVGWHPATSWVCNLSCLGRKKWRCFSMGSCSSRVVCLGLLVEFHVYRECGNPKLFCLHEKPKLILVTCSHFGLGSQCQCMSLSHIHPMPKKANCSTIFHRNTCPAKLGVFTTSRHVKTQIGETMWNWIALWFADGVCRWESFFKEGVCRSSSWVWFTRTPWDSRSFATAKHSKRAKRQSDWWIFRNSKPRSSKNS